MLDVDKSFNFDNLTFSNLMFEKRSIGTPKPNKISFINYEHFNSSYQQQRKSANLGFHVQGADVAYTWHGRLLHKRHHNMLRIFGQYKASFSYLLSECLAQFGKKALDMHVIISPVYYHKLCLLNKLVRLSKDPSLRYSWQVSNLSFK